MLNNSSSRAKGKDVFPFTYRDNSYLTLRQKSLKVLTVLWLLNWANHWLQMMNQQRLLINLPKGAS